MLQVEQQSALALSSNKKSKGKAKTSARSEAKTSSLSESTLSSSTPLAFPLSGTLPKEELDRAMYSLKRRFVDNVYVPGHCWFEAAAQSYPPTAGVLPKLGASLFRRVLSFGYNELNVRGSISSCTGTSFMEHKDRVRQPIKKS